MAIPRAAVIRRSHALSPGAIAGAVIGSLIGGSVLLIVLGFLYFFYRRKAKKDQVDDALPVSQVSDPDHAASSSWPGVDSPRTGTLHLGRSPSGREEGSNGSYPIPPVNADTQRSPTSPRGGEDWMNNGPAYDHQVLVYDTLPPDINFSLPSPQQTRTFPIAAEHSITAPLNHASTAPEAANSSYYDTRISMDSEPAPAAMMPTLQMTPQMSELYKAQLKEAEEHRRSSSFHKRLWNTITRQSTRNSKGTVGDSAQYSSSQQQHQDTIKQEPGQGSPEGAAWTGAAPEYVEEPEQIADGGPNLGFHMPGSGRQGEHQLPSPIGGYRYQTGDSQYGGFPGRIDSTGVLPTIENPELPSSVLATGPTYGLPLSAKPQSPIAQGERLKSPEIPEPMDVDGFQPDTNGHSPFRSSHSPQLSPDSFTINPMAILQPTNPTEQAAYTTYQIKHSASPPVMPPPAPQIVTQQPTQEDTISSPPPRGDDFADMYLQFPGEDDYRRSMDSYDYSSTPGQSSTVESTGRTPDTHPTASPSPFPTIPEYGTTKPDPSVLPNSSKLSPQSGALVCPECSREFDQIHKLNHHKRYHDRTHECPYPDCDRKFGTKTHLDRHINDRHLKLKAYHCTEPTCAWFKGGKSFPRKDNWRRHMTKKHGTTPQDFDQMEMQFG
ncbi:putative zinc finger protein 2 [Rosellinia necatrix]|uniref:C2H2 type master regulator of conidiophore development brlA n=1 Tax=Rosellinia necatrix TaxID=77044 RepID=A0A1W2TU30_ROSNE|nr:putative zinc finger protein 2 [Rosellinia necatrix]